MSTQQTTDTTTTDAGTTTTSTDTTTGGGAAATATEPTGTEAKPPWGDDFDPARAWQTIQNQRRIETELKAKVSEYEREKLTEQEKAEADLAAAKTAAEAAKQEVLDARFEAAAIGAGIPPERIAAARAVAGEFTTTDATGIVSVDTSVFDRLKADHEYLFGQAAPPTTQVSFGAAVSQGQGGQQGTLSADEVAMAQRAGMTPDEWAKYAQRTKR